MSSRTDTSCTSRGCEPRPSLGQALWLVLAGLAAVLVGGTSMLLGRLIRGAILGGVTFTALVGAGYRSRTNDSRRMAEPDGGGGLPGFICLPDRLLIRYPDSLYELPRAKLRSICRHARSHAKGEMAMAEYDMRAQIDVGAAAPVELVLAEVVDLIGHQESAEISERMAVLLVLADYLEQTWRTGE